MLRKDKRGGGGVKPRTLTTRLLLTALDERIVPDATLVYYDSVDAYRAGNPTNQDVHLVTNQPLYIGRTAGGLDLYLTETDSLDLWLQSVDGATGNEAAALLQGTGQWEVYSTYQANYANDPRVEVKPEGAVRTAGPKGTTIINPDGSVAGRIAPEEQYIPPPGSVGRVGPDGGNQWWPPNIAPPIPPSAQAPAAPATPPPVKPSAPPQPLPPPRVIESRGQTPGGTRIETTPGGVTTTPRNGPATMQPIPQPGVAPVAPAPPQKDVKSAWTDAQGNRHVEFKDGTSQVTAPSGHRDVYDANGRLVECFYPNGMHEVYPNDGVNISIQYHPNGDVVTFRKDGIITTVHPNPLPPR